MHPLPFFRAFHGSIRFLLINTCYWPIKATLKRSRAIRSEEHTSELQSLMRISYAVFCLTKKTIFNVVHDPTVSLDQVHPYVNTADSTQATNSQLEVQE